MRAKAFGDILLQNLCFNEVYHLASSKITKKALANALKEVMVEKPFEKIIITSTTDLDAVWRTPQEIKADYEGRVIVGEKLNVNNVII